MKTSNLAIVFTDIKGFTERTGRQSYAENQRMLRLHDGLLVPVFAAFDGRLVKTIGDAFLVVFESPTKAVLSGAAIQDRLWEYNRKARTEDQIHVRVAINLGEVREEKGDVFGEPVNIAARVEGIAEAGEVVFTEAVYLAMNRAEVPAEEHGVHQLKGISTPIRLWRVPLRGENAPYGGLGLMRAGRLPSTDPEELSRNREIVPQLLARAEGLQRALGPATLRLMGTQARLWSRLHAWLEVRQVPALVRRLPVRRLAIPLLLLLLLALWLGLRGDAVERAVDRGDLHEASRLVQKLPPGPARTYDKGRIEEARAAWASAASHYAEAAGGGEGRALRRLVRLTRAEKCAARESAANALGHLGRPGTRGALESLASGSFPDEGEDSALGSLFGCSSRRAAREALEKLRP